VAERILTRVRRLPVPLAILLIYLAARVVTTLFLLAAAGLSDAGGRFGADADYTTLALGWDAQWYWFVAVHGYPSELPLTPTGAVAENQWAFLPLYPYLSAAVGAILGSWGAGAVAVSLAAGYGACAALYALLRRRLDASASLWAVAFFASGPLAALFQVGYAEVLFVFLLLVALGCVLRRRYGWLYLLIPVMGFTRPGILAFALFLGLFGLWRLRHRRDEPLGRAEVVHILALAALATAVGFAWQAIAGIVTGDPGAYLATELAWRRNWIPGAEAHFFPFEGFVTAAGFWFTNWGLPVWAGYVALVLLVAGAAAALLLVPQVRRLGVEVRLWSASYVLYLLAVFFPQSSLFRLLLPLTPLTGALAVPRSLRWRIGVLVVGVALQWVWIFNVYAQARTFWQVP
jgi:hypothetical protein